MESRDVTPPERRRTGPLLPLIFVPLVGCATASNYLDPDAPRYRGSFAAPGGAETAAIRVVSFNLEHGRNVRDAIRLLRGRPELRGADLLLLQEMQAPGVEEIARALSLDCVYYPASRQTRQQRDIGNAVLSRWPIERSWKVVLPHLSRFSRHARAATAARVRIRGRPLRVYSLHLGTPLNLSGQQRREQLGAILEDARTSPDPVLIGGDFNGRSLAEWLAARAYEWPTRAVGKTTATWLGHSFDHVLVRGLGALAGARSGVVRDVDGISDHYPVWVMLPVGQDPSDPSRWQESDSLGLP